MLTLKSNQITLLGYDIPTLTCHEGKQKHTQHFGYAGRLSSFRVSRSTLHSRGAKLIPESRPGHGKARLSGVGGGHSHAAFPLSLHLLSLDQK